MNKPDFLFDDSPVSAQVWKLALQAGLNGGDYNSLLTSTLPEGIHIKPFYNREDLPAGVSEFAQNRAPWKIGTVMQANGSNSEFQNPEDWQDGIDTWITQIPSSDTVWPDWMKTREFWPEEVVLIPSNPYNFDFDRSPNLLIGKTEVLLDPIGNFARTGTWVKQQASDLDSLPDVIQKIRDNGFSYGMLIGAECYQQAGANTVQEIAYALAHAREYLLRASDNTTPNSWVGVPTFRLAMGGEYFSDISKIRALRQGWALLAKAEKFPTACRIWVHPSLRNKTQYDYNTNLLRTTLECMAGILGGADLISNLPYDAVYQPANAFSDRLARNQLLLLRHEANLDKVTNPADGAFFIEHLTNQFGKKALELLKTLEKGGGLIAQLKNHNLQQKIRQSANSEQAAFDANLRVLVGSNLHPNPQDRLPGLPISAKRNTSVHRTEIEPLLTRRLAQPYETKRSQNETK